MYSDNVILIADIWGRGNKQKRKMKINTNTTIIVTINKTDKIDENKKYYMDKF